MGTVSKLPKTKGTTVPPTKTPEDRFVEEYMIDRDPVSAAIRAGVAAINVKSRVKAWMSNPVVMQKIQEATDNADLDTMVKPQRVIAGFMSVAFDPMAPSAARNAALKELATLSKMYPEKDDPSKRKPGRNVMFVPTSPSLDDWEKAATAQQARLREDVRK